MMFKKFKVELIHVSVPAEVQLAALKHRRIRRSTSWVDSIKAAFAWLT